MTLTPQQLRAYHANYLLPWPGLIFCGGHLVALPFALGLLTTDIVLGFPKRQGPSIAGMLLLVTAAVPMLWMLANHGTKVFRAYRQATTDRMHVPSFLRKKQDGDLKLRYEPTYSACEIAMAGIGVSEIGQYFGVDPSILTAFAILFIVVIVWHLADWIAFRQAIVVEDGRVSHRRAGLILWEYPITARFIYHPSKCMLECPRHETIQLAGLFRPDLLLKHIRVTMPGIEAEPYGAPV